MPDLDALCTITNAIFQADLAKLQSLKAEEIELQRQMEELDAEVRRASALGNVETNAMQQLGGDLLWKAWVGRKRQMLNRELARLRVQKEHAVRVIETSFGKCSVSQKLRNQDRQNQIRKRAERTLAEEQAQIVIRARHRKSSGM